MNRSKRNLGAALVAAAALFGTAGAQAHEGEDPLDPAHNVALPCEAVGTPGLAPRSAKNIAHVANVCGFVGTDIEFQSRVDSTGEVRDYAFVGTMGAGTRIFDVTDPAHPFIAGGYADPGWQNDVHVRGNLLVLAFDWLVVGAHVSTCLQQKNLEAGSVEEGGIDIARLAYDAKTGTFTTSRVGCYRSSISTGGSHTVTIHPSGDWIAVNTSFAGVEVVDVRGTEPRLAVHLKPSLVGTAHDVSFSRDGKTMYVASPETGTYVIDVSNVLNGEARRLAFIPQTTHPGGTSNPYNLTTSHQSDVSSDGRVLVYTDERGGGLSNRSCNTDPNGVIGGMHFWALAPIDGQSQTGDASPATPRRLGTWLYPNPMLALDALDPVLAGLGRTERGCTIHVFRNGGNGSAGPGEIAPGFDGVSRLPADEAVSAHYGAGVWHIDFGAPPTDADGTDEHPQTDWGNTRGWNVMPGADTWSAKEYKGFIYAGDMTRGFDVYTFAACDDLECIRTPTSMQGRAHGGGGSTMAELEILRGTTAGGRATFGFDVSYGAADLVPGGHLSFVDHKLKKHVEATVIDSFTALGNTARFRGRATVDGVPGVAFYVEVEDLGPPRSGDRFRIVLGDGYGAAGTLSNGNVTVESGSVFFG